MSESLMYTMHILALYMLFNEIHVFQKTFWLLVIGVHEYGLKTSRNLPSCGQGNVAVGLLDNKLKHKYKDGKH